MIYTLPLRLEDVLQIIITEVSGKNSIDECGISIWANDELVADAEIVEDMPKTRSYLEYGSKHGTLRQLHAQIDSVGGTVWAKSSQGSRLSKLRVVNLTLLKAFLVSGNYSAQFSGFDYEIQLFAGGRSYTERMGQDLLDALSKITGERRSIVRG